ncbi:MAG: tRNA (N6-isopentenyl adenosine(37)-C2)-methylthiotransferase MiaB [Chloroflexota bacterium]|nr:tRNA (N6-isopentenyl adenosine(37)-C2)-methylthiotransferase MiaB [Chloroflexota bacterium]MQF66262.1 tRNA (N6-isopentenyl adenosine(37)-C2)-methylthiotransferase MiaB [SAR202 cluster bacterium AC-647-P02_OGT_505m]
MKSYHIWTTGCQMNKADSDRLCSALDQLGLTPSSSRTEADIVVLNTCVVRQNAEDKAVGTLTSLKPNKEANPEKIIALMGCMVGPKTEPLERRFPFVDVFMRPQQYDPLIDLLSERLGVDPEGCIGPLSAAPSVSTFIPIIHGCDKFCSFCIIPYRRGRETSREISEIVYESEMLVARGVKEVTLLGQNVDSYGHDLSGSVNLSNLLAAVNEVKGIERIRFLTSHPNDMDDSIIDAVGGLDKVCEHINLPFQAGDDDILQSMRRGYTNYEYRKIIDKIRCKVPGVSLSTDLIVGFCGETDQQFESTLQLVRDIKFDKVHSAAYSTRKGTIADRKMIDNVPEEIKKDRLRQINDEQEGISTEINSRVLGECHEVLVEGTKDGRWFGRNRNDKLVFFDSTETEKGDMTIVKIEETSPWFLQGSLYNTKNGSPDNPINS